MDCYSNHNIAELNIIPQCLKPYYHLISFICRLAFLIKTFVFSGVLQFEKVRPQIVGEEIFKIRRFELIIHQSITYFVPLLLRWRNYSLIRSVLELLLRTMNHIR